MSASFESMDAAVDGVKKFFASFLSTTAIPETRKTDSLSTRVPVRGMTFPVTVKTSLPSDAIPPAGQMPSA